MFFKITKGKRQEYLYLVEGYRQDGKIKHRKICSFGQINNLDPSFVQSFMQITKLSDSFELIDVANTTVTERINYGSKAVVNYFWKHFGFTNLITGLKSKTKLKINVEETLKLLLTSRLLKPESKLQTHNHQKYYGGARELELHKLYRTLDFLANCSSEIQKHLYHQQIIKESMQVNVVFYDVTTFYFESVEKDDLKDFGFSKDCKVNQVQVMLSILVNHEGRPIKFDIHKGNSYEGHTLAQALKTISTEYGIKTVVLVADRGINNNQNLLAITKAGFDYVVGSRIRSASVEMKKQILDIASYKAITRDDANNVSLVYKVLDNEKRTKIDKKIEVIKNKLVCTWSSKRAAKDKADRLRLVASAKDMLENHSFLSSRGARKYINTTIKGAPHLKEEKILEDEKWDGFYAIETSSKSLSAEEVAKAYHQLWVVEESFRILKHHFETRPMFHWTPKRIIGHLVLSYISFLFERTLELKLKTQNLQEVTHARIREALIGMEFLIVKSSDRKLRLCAQHNGLASEIISTLNLERPLNCKI